MRGYIPTLESIFSTSVVSFLDTRGDYRAGLSLPEGLDTDNFISKLIWSNDLLYNLYSFVQESVHLGKNFLSKMVCIEWKITFPYV